jgi:hypothetical protein
MASTYIEIASVTVGSGGASSIDFTSIAGTYTDLIVKGSFRTNRTASLAENILVQFNGVTSSYSTKYLEGNGSSASSSTGSSSSLLSGYGDTDLNTGSTFGNWEMYIPNYAGSTNKTTSTDSVTENNASTAFAVLSAGIWAPTGQAITSIKIFPQLGPNFMQHSTAYLYGIKKD